jgi:phosphate-selective porin OprO/OprP
MQKLFLAGTASAAALLAVTPSHARAASVDSRITALQHQIEEQQEQLQQQQQRLQQQQQLLTSLITSDQQTKAEVKATRAAVKPSKPSVVAVMSRANRPGWRSADGKNEIDLGATLQVDAGINSYRPSSKVPVGGVAPLTKLQSGINARRAQIQVSGTFDVDWHFALQYDMGGSNEQFGASAGGVTSGFKTALLTYTGIKPWGTDLSLEFGYTAPPVAIESATPSNALLFMEYPSPNRLETFSAGPGIPTLGFRDFTNRWFVYYAFASARAGAVHDQTVNANGLGNGTGSQTLTAIGRASYNVINDKDVKVQVDGAFERYLQPPKTFTLSDEAEDRVDPTTFVGVNITPTGNNVLTGGGDYTFESAVEAGPFFWSGAYIRYDAERRGLPENDFWGAYGSLMYSITGEQHPYLVSSAGWGNLNPAHPFSLKTGGMGAWEVGARYSYANFNDSPAGVPAAAVNGGHFNDLTLGVNWYVNQNIRFQLNWMHGFTGGANPTGLNATTATLQSGSKIPVYNARWDEIATRMQFTF